MRVWGHVDMRVEMIYHNVLFSSLRRTVEKTSFKQTFQDVRQVGLEPTTSPLVGEHSRPRGSTGWPCPLSYWRM